jgi:hypothetical protein
MQNPGGPRPAVARLELSFMSTTHKFFLAVTPTFFLAVMAYLAGLMLGSNNASRYPLPSAFVLCFDALVLALVVLNVFNLAILSRAGAWLEGTTLVVCGLSRRKADLAAVPVSIGAVGGWLCLVARDSATGRDTRLALSRLAAPELTALADAIVAYGRQDPGAWQVADALRRRAAARLEAGQARQGVPSGMPGMPGPPGYPGYRGSGG